jgi:hypothetical protein
VKLEKVSRLVYIAGISTAGTIDRQAPQGVPSNVTSSNRKLRLSASSTTAAELPRELFLTATG